MVSVRTIAASDRLGRVLYEVTQERQRTIAEQRYPACCAGSPFPHGEAQSGTGEELAEACRAWQGGRDGGSSPIRAGARLLTGTEHYFSAPYIAALERAAGVNDATMRRAKLLLDALHAASRRDAAGWAAAAGVDSGWAGRGIQSKLEHAEDQQILASLATGTITMPLWGVSLDRTVAEQFGSRFTFELVGDFPAIPAWLHSGVKNEERELVVGGAYTIEGLRDEADDRTVVRLRFVSVVAPLAQPAP